MGRATDKVFGEDEGLRTDMSPMIDLVFLLLIFFMTSSTLISYRKDQRVAIPIASSSAVPKIVSDRVIINVLRDGTCYDEEGTTRLSLDRVESLMRAAKTKHANPKLHLRVDERTPHALSKKVIDASRKGGVSQVIFSTYVTDK